MAVAVVFLPLLAAFIAGFFGRVIGDRGAEIVTCGAIVLSALLGIPLFREILTHEHAQIVLEKRDPLKLRQVQNSSHRQG